MTAGTCSRPLRITLLLTQPNLGGASRAALRLKAELEKLGAACSLVMMNEWQVAGEENRRQISPPRRWMNRQLSRLDRCISRIFVRPDRGFFTPGGCGAGWEFHADLLAEADVILLTWVGQGFLSIGQIGRLKQLGKPVVWRFSDMWAFTGGCHYSGDCRRFEKNCGCCPLTEKHRERDISYVLLEKKARAWRDLPLTVVAPSRWMAGQAVSSRLLQGRRMEVIPTGINGKVFRPVERQAIRFRFGFDETKQHRILFGAFNANRAKRKGADLLVAALNSPALLARSATTQLVVFGADTRPAGLAEDWVCQSLGVIEDEARLAELFSACDVFVAPAREENLANTCIEALACGCPIVGFDVGGMPDVVLHQKTGYLAPPFAPEGLADGIDWVLARPDTELLRQRSRELFCSRFESAHCARQYLALLLELCAAN